jgi:hypothetical protein
MIFNQKPTAHVELTNVLLWKSGREKTSLAAS